MFLEKINLSCFRNYREQTVFFDAPKTILLGNNAQGKTNLLEAVELLSTLKSQRAKRDQDLILEGKNESQVWASLERAYSKSELSLILRTSGRRSLFLNQEPLRRHLDGLGVVNTVQFSSLDLELVRGAPEARRHWLDSLLIQLEPVSAYILQQYHKILRQRNALLKKLYKSEKANLVEQDLTELDLWDGQLAVYGSRVMRRRRRVLERLTPLAQHWHNQISGKTEFLAIEYSPNLVSAELEPEQLQADFLLKLQERRLVEQNLGTTVVGPHRDEVELLINKTAAKYYGSQGQQRTLVLALKLAELELIETVVGEAPLLLLDDVLAELDLQRQNQLLEAIASRCQTLITTTHLNSFDAQWLKGAQILYVEAGQINSQKYSH